MQNIGKTDINSPGSTSQQEHRQERPLKAVRKRRQVRLSAETKEQRQARLETERVTSKRQLHRRRQTDIRAKTAPSCSKKTKERIWRLDYHRKGFNIRLILN